MDLHDRTTPKHLNPEKEEQNDPNNSKTNGPFLIQKPPWSESINNHHNGINYDHQNTQYTQPTPNANHHSPLTPQTLPTVSPPFSSHAESINQVVRPDEGSHENNEIDLSNHLPHDSPLTHSSFHTTLSHPSNISVTSNRSSFDRRSDQQMNEVILDTYIHTHRDKNHAFGKNFAEWRTEVDWRHENDGKQNELGGESENNEQLNNRVAGGNIPQSTIHMNIPQNICQAGTNDGDENETKFLHNFHQNSATFDSGHQNIEQQLRLSPHNSPNSHRNHFPKKYSKKRAELDQQYQSFLPKPLTELECEVIRQKKPNSFSYIPSYNIFHYLNQWHSHPLTRKFHLWVVITLIALSAGILCASFQILMKHLTIFKFDTVNAYLKTYSENPTEISHFVYAVLIYLTWTLVPTVIAGVLILYEPLSLGSGMINVKGFLNGLNIKGYFTTRLLVIKTIVTLLTAISGVPTGTQSALIHNSSMIGGIFGTNYQKIIIFFSCCGFFRKKNGNSHKVNFFAEYDAIDEPLLLDNYENTITVPKDDGGVYSDEDLISRNGNGKSRGYYDQKQRYIGGYYDNNEINHQPMAKSAKVNHYDRKHRDFKTTQNVSKSTELTHEPIYKSEENAVSIYPSLIHKYYFPSSIEMPLPLLQHGHTNCSTCLLCPKCLYDKRFMMFNEDGKAGDGKNDTNIIDAFITPQNSPQSNPSRSNSPSSPLPPLIQSGYSSHLTNLYLLTITNNTFFSAPILPSLPLPSTSPRPDQSTPIDPFNTLLKSYPTQNILISPTEYGIFNANAQLVFPQVIDKYLFDDGLGNLVPITTSGRMRMATDTRTILDNGDVALNPIGEGVLDRAGILAHHATVSSLFQCSIMRDPMVGFELNKDQTGRQLSRLNTDPLRNGPISNHVHHRGGFAQPDGKPMKGSKVVRYGKNVGFQWENSGEFLRDGSVGDTIPIWDMHMTHQALSDANSNLSAENEYFLSPTSDYSTQTGHTKTFSPNFENSPLFSAQFEPNRSSFRNDSTSRNNSSALVTRGHRSRTLDPNDLFIDDRFIGGADPDDQTGLPTLRESDAGASGSFEELKTTRPDDGNNDGSLKLQTVFESPIRFEGDPYIQDEKNNEENRDNEYRIRQAQIRHKSSTALLYKPSSSKFFDDSSSDEEVEIISGEEAHKGFNDSYNVPNIQPDERNAASTGKTKFYLWEEVPQDYSTEESLIVSLHPSQYRDYRKLYLAYYYGTGEKNQHNIEEVQHDDDATQIGLPPRQKVHNSLASTKKHPSISRSSSFTSYLHPHHHQHPYNHQLIENPLLQSTKLPSIATDHGGYINSHQRTFLQSRQGGPNASHSSHFYPPKRQNDGRLNLVPGPTHDDPLNDPSGRETMPLMGWTSTLPPLLPSTSSRRHVAINTQNLSRQLTGIKEASSASDFAKVATKPTLLYLQNLDKKDKIQEEAKEKKRAAKRAEKKKKKRLEEEKRWKYEQAKYEKIEAFRRLQADKLTASYVNRNLHIYSDAGSHLRGSFSNKLSLSGKEHTDIQDRNEEEKKPEEIPQIAETGSIDPIPQSPNEITTYRYDNLHRLSQLGLVADISLLQGLDTPASTSRPPLSSHNIPQSSIPTLSTLTIVPPSWLASNSPLITSVSPHDYREKSAVGSDFGLEPPEGKLDEQTLPRPLSVEGVDDMDRVVGDDNDQFIYRSVVKNNNAQKHMKRKKSLNKIKSPGSPNNESINLPSLKFSRTAAYNCEAAYFSNKISQNSRPSKSRKNHPTLINNLSQIPQPRGIDSSSTSSSGLSSRKSTDRGSLLGYSSKVRFQDRSSNFDPDQNSQTDTSSTGLDDDTQSEENDDSDVIESQTTTTPHFTQHDSDETMRINRFVPHDRAGNLKNETLLLTSPSNAVGVYELNHLDKNSGYRFYNTERTTHGLDLYGGDEGDGSWGGTETVFHDQSRPNESNSIPTFNPNRLIDPTDLKSLLPHPCTCCARHFFPPKDHKPVEMRRIPYDTYQSERLFRKLTQHRAKKDRIANDGYSPPKRDLNTYEVNQASPQNDTTRNYGSDDIRSIPGSTFIRDSDPSTSPSNSPNYTKTDDIGESDDVKPLIDHTKHHQNFPPHKPGDATLSCFDRFKTARVIPSFNDDFSMRICIALGVIAGVSGSTGSIFGSILFALEDVISFTHGNFLMQAVWVVLLVSNCWLIGRSVDGDVVDVIHKRIIFQFWPGNFDISFHFQEIVLALLLGMGAGLLGQFFLMLQQTTTRLRSKYFKLGSPGPKQQSARKLFDTILISMLWSFICIALPLAFAGQCKPIPTVYRDSMGDQTHYLSEKQYTFPQFTCPEGQYNEFASLSFEIPGILIDRLLTRNAPHFLSYGSMILFFVLYFFATGITSQLTNGTGAVIPTITMGACYGRIVGKLFYSWFSINPDSTLILSGDGQLYDPGIYAVCGATAFFAAIQSSFMFGLVVIEMVGDVELILLSTFSAFGALSVKLAITFYKTHDVESSLNPHENTLVRVRKMPYIQASVGTRPSKELLLLNTVDNLMASRVVMLGVVEQVWYIMYLLENTTYTTFPIVINPCRCWMKRRYEIEKQNQAQRDAQIALGLRESQVIDDIDGDNGDILNHPIRNRINRTNTISVTNQPSRLSSVNGPHRETDSFIDVHDVFQYDGSTAKHRDKRDPLIKRALTNQTRQNRALTSEIYTDPEAGYEIEQTILGGHDRYQYYDISHVNEGDAFQQMPSLPKSSSYRSHNNATTVNSSQSRLFGYNDNRSYIEGIDLELGRHVHQHPSNLIKTSPKSHIPAQPNSVIQETTNFHPKNSSASPDLSRNPSQTTSQLLQTTQRSSGSRENDHLGSVDAHSLGNRTGSAQIGSIDQYKPITSLLSLYPQPSLNSNPFPCMCSKNERCMCVEGGECICNPNQIKINGFGKGMAFGNRNYDQTRQKSSHHSPPNLHPGSGCQNCGCTCEYNIDNTYIASISRRTLLLILNHRVWRKISVGLTWRKFQFISSHSHVDLKELQARMLFPQYQEYYNQIILQRHLEQKKLQRRDKMREKMNKRRKKGLYFENIDNNDDLNNNSDVHNHEYPFMSPNKALYSPHTHQQFPHGSLSSPHSSTQSNIGPIGNRPTTHHTKDGNVLLTPGGTGNALIGGDFVDIHKQPQQGKKIKGILKKEGTFSNLDQGHVHHGKTSGKLENFQTNLSGSPSGDDQDISFDTSDDDDYNDSSYSFDESDVEFTEFKKIYQQQILSQEQNSPHNHNDSQKKQKSPPKVHFSPLHSHPVDSLSHSSVAPGMNNAATIQPTTWLINDYTSFIDVVTFSNSSHIVVSYTTSTDIIYKLFVTTQCAYIVVVGMDNQVVGVVTKFDMIGDILASKYAMLLRHTYERHKESILDDSLYGWDPSDSDGEEERSGEKMEISQKKTPNVQSENNGGGIELVSLEAVPNDMVQINIDKFNDDIIEKDGQYYSPDNTIKNESQKNNYETQIFENDFPNQNNSNKISKQVTTSMVEVEANIMRSVHNKALYDDYPTNHVFQGNQGQKRADNNNDDQNEGERKTFIRSGPELRRELNLIRLLSRISNTTALDLLRERHA